MKLFDKIRILRKARGLSQEQLGYSLSRVNKDGISRQTISDWENGNFEPKLENVRDLAQVLDVSFDVLLDESVDLNDEKVLNDILNNNKVEDELIVAKPVVVDKTPKGLMGIGEALLLVVNAIILFIGISGFFSYLTYLIGFKGQAADQLMFPFIISTVSMLFGGLSLGLLVYQLVKRKSKYFVLASAIILLVLSLAMFALTIVTGIQSIQSYLNTYRMGSYDSDKVMLAHTIVVFVVDVLTDLVTIALVFISLSKFKLRD